MGFLVSTGASLQCSFGTTPSMLNVLPVNRVMGMTPCANILDSKPMVNILPFGMCNSQMNPAVIAAKAVPPPGVHKPQPCVPVTSAPWAPGSPTVLIGNMPALNNSSKCLCNWGGVVSINSPGQTKIMVP